jgi:uncharacterized protein YndB with AHSA1/START domain
MLIVYKLNFYNEEVYLEIETEKRIRYCWTPDFSKATKFNSQEEITEKINKFGIGAIKNFLVKEIN